MEADTEGGGCTVDAAAVRATVNRYNELCAKGSDDDFGEKGRLSQSHPFLPGLGEKSPWWRCLNPSSLAEARRVLLDYGR